MIKKLLAYYKLESNYLAINSDRSQYILLTETQVKDCVQSGLQICNVKSPIRNANVGLNCLLSNFNQDKVHVKKFCKYGYIKPLYQLHFICLMMFTWLFWISQQYFICHVRKKKVEDSKLIHHLVF